MKLNLGCGPDPLLRPGMVNMDKRRHQLTPPEAEIVIFRFEEGLPMFSDESVEGVTISHALGCGLGMGVEQAWWPRIFREIHRVLEPGGVVRVTESQQHVDGESLKAELARAGFSVFDVSENETRFKDDSLRQCFHKGPAIWVEAIK